MDQLSVIVEFLEEKSKAKEIRTDLGDVVSIIRGLNWVSMRLPGCYSHSLNSSCGLFCIFYSAH